MNERTVKKLFRNGEIPGAFKVGEKVWRLRREDYDRYITEKVHRSLAHASLLPITALRGK